MLIKHGMEANIGIHLLLVNSGLWKPENMMWALMCFQYPVSLDFLVRIEVTF